MFTIILYKLANIPKIIVTNVWKEEPSQLGKKDLKITKSDYNDNIVHYSFYNFIISSKQLTLNTFFIFIKSENKDFQLNKVLLFVQTKVKHLFH